MSRGVLPQRLDSRDRSRGIVDGPTMARPRVDVRPKPNAHAPNRYWQSSVDQGPRYRPAGTTTSPMTMMMMMIRPFSLQVQSLHVSIQTKTQKPEKYGARKTLGKDWPTRKWTNISVYENNRPGCIYGLLSVVHGLHSLPLEPE
jgi:hypothetical protein